MCKTAASIAEQKAKLFSEISKDKSDITEANVARAQRHLEACRRLAKNFTNCAECQREADA